MKELAPIVVFVYNRPWHARKTLEALAENELADKSDLFIYADGPKKGAPVEDIQKIEEVRKVIREKQWCKSVNINERDENLGLARSVIAGVTEVTNEYGKAIILEDDIITSSGFLSFLNDSLTHYEQTDPIFGISGYRYPIRSVTRIKHNHFFLPISSSWGWGTWKERWDTIDFSSKFLLKRLQNEGLAREFNFGNHEFYEMLRKQKDGVIDSWAICYYASMFLENGLFVYPKYSIVKNIGFDGFATHTKKGYNAYKSELADHCEITPQWPSIDPVLMKEVKKIGIGKSANVLNRIRDVVIGLSFRT